jgi:hypothetical protein
MQGMDRASAPVVDISLRAGIVALTLATAFIHSTLGGMLFTLNALGYVALAMAMVLPIGLFRDIRWLTRVVLVGYTATTVIGWYLIGPRYDTAYIAKGIELVLIALLIVESYHVDGSPVRIARRLSRLSRLGRLVGRTGGHTVTGDSNGTPTPA